MKTKEEKVLTDVSTIINDYFNGTNNFNPPVDKQTLIDNIVDEAEGILDNLEDDGSTFRMDDGCTVELDEIIVDQSYSLRQFRERIELLLTGND
jgi:hypothetical protein